MNKNKFEKDLQDAILICERELIQRRQGVIGDGSVELLETLIIPELKKYLQLSIDENLPPKGARWLASARAFNDGWVYDRSHPSLMACMILELERKYF